MSLVSPFAALCHVPLSFQVKSIVGQPFLDLTDWRRLTGLQELSLQVRIQHPLVYTYPCTGYDQLAFTLDFE